MRIPHDHAQAAMAEELGHRSKRGEFFNEDNSRLRYLTGMSTTRRRRGNVRNFRQLETSARIIR